jgi:hypothetical protein
MRQEHYMTPGVLVSDEQAVPSGYVMVLAAELESALDCVTSNEPFYAARELRDIIAKAQLAPAPAERVGQEPFAWATFDGEGSYDLRLYECNESYQSQFLARHKSATYKDWVFPLYTAPQPSPDVAGLVDALEKAAVAMWESEANMDNDAANAEAALAAHRQQEQSHER